MKDMKTNPAKSEITLLLNKLKHNFNLDHIFVHKPKDNYDKVPLTETGQKLVKKAIEICLANNIAPDCSVSGEDLTCGSEVISLNPMEWVDLIAKIENIAKN